MDFFILVLGVALKLPSNTCHKGMQITWVLAKEGLKLLLGYMDIFALVELVVMLILHLSKADASVKKKDSKQGTIGLNGPSNIEIIFALLAKVVVVHM